MDYEDEDRYDEPCDRCGYHPAEMDGLCKLCWQTQQREDAHAEAL